MRSILIDTNLLVLLLLGNLDRNEVGKNKRIKRYSVNELDLLVSFATQFPRHVSTPHVLTETSNLIGAGEREEVRGATSAFAQYCMQVDEQFCEARVISQGRWLEKLGLTDAAIIEKLVPKGVLVLTDDYKLAGHINFLGGEAVNIWHAYRP
ncbi:MAG: hypothetical protein EA338_00770 [Roseinatronobacter sp.]|nr:MAG: hypothetical protein EA338_00770 [Roseinatronobacter sp.]